MNNKLKAILKGVAAGAKETPREFFAPIIAFATVMHRATEEVLSGPQPKKDHVHPSAQDMSDE